MHIFALVILPEFYTHLLEIQLRCFVVVVVVFRHQRVACRILAVPLAETMQHPNHWTTRKAPQTPCFTSAQLRPSGLRSNSFLASGMSPSRRQQSEPPSAPCSSTQQGGLAWNFQNFSSHWVSLYCPSDPPPYCHRVIILKHRLAKDASARWRKVTLLSVPRDSIAWCWPR